MSGLEDRLTSRFTRVRLKLEAKRASRPLAVVAIAVVAGAAGTAFLISHISNTLFRDVRTVSFAVPDATGLKGGISEVRFKGIPVGDVVAVRIEGGQAVVETKLQAKYGPIYRDARAAVRPNTALQDMYIDITSRGHADAGSAEGQTIPKSNVTSAVNVSDVLDTFGVDERTRLRELLRDLGNGLADHGQQLDDAFVQLVPFVRQAQRISAVLARRHQATSRLTHNFALLTTELGRRTMTLRRLIVEGNTAAVAMADRDPQIDATLRELAPVVTALRGSLQSLHQTLPDVNTAARALMPLARQLPSALDELDAIDTAAVPALRRLQSPVRLLRATAAVLRPVSDDLDTTVTALRPQAGTFNLVTSAAVACKKGINGFFQWNTSMTKFGDADGAFPRGNLAAGGGSAGVSNPYESPQTACTGGHAVGGRPPTAAELGEGTP